MSTEVRNTIASDQLRMTEGSLVDDWGTEPLRMNVRLDREKSRSGLEDTNFALHRPAKYKFGGRVHGATNEHRIGPRNIDPPVSTKNVLE
jgi:hypothetical protein